MGVDNVATLSWGFVVPKDKLVALLECFRKHTSSTKGPRNNESTEHFPPAPDGSCTIGDTVSDDNEDGYKDKDGQGKDEDEYDNEGDRLDEEHDEDHWHKQENDNEREEEQRSVGDKRKRPEAESKSKAKRQKYMSELLYSGPCGKTAEELIKFVETEMDKGEWGQTFRPIYVGDNDSDRAVELAFVYGEKQSVAGYWGEEFCALGPRMSPKVATKGVREEEVKKFQVAMHLEEAGIELPLKGEWILSISIG